MPVVQAMQYMFYSSTSLAGHMARETTLLHVYITLLCKKIFEIEAIK